MEYLQPKAATGPLVSKISSDGGDFLCIIEIALIFIWITFVLRPLMNKKEVIELVMASSFQEFIYQFI